MSEWTEVPLGELVDIHDSRRVPLSSTERSKRKGPFPYYGAQSVIDHIDDYIFDGRYILVPEDGENLRSRKLPIAYFAEGRFWVNNHAHIIKAKPDRAVDRFIQSALEATHIGQWVTGAAQPKLSQANLKQIPILVPSRDTQQVIASVLDAFDELIENNRRRVEVLDEMVRAIYREWFVEFRYPGHEGVQLVDSALGPIPLNWEVVPLVSVASETGAGPFGSKLGRKDYQPHGVPVIRGANLRVGGGFDERNFAFVSPAKADELRSSWALRGDIIVTQRGTLGQVGMIPRGSQFDLYVLSQSQMKVTLERSRAAAEFVYAQLCSDPTVQRFVSRAMTAGVPHVNLRLLREFEVLLPPTSMQGRFAEVAGPLMDLASRLEREQLSLARLRDALLPKLVTGQIDVSTLNPDALVSTSSTGGRESVA